jgi:hypothetical protein
MALTIRIIPGDKSALPVTGMLQATRIFMCSTSFLVYFCILGDSLCS